MSSVLKALVSLNEAQREFEAASLAIARHTAAHGPSVWLEGHPLDIEKLRRQEAAFRVLEAESRNFTAAREGTLGGSA